MQIIVRNRSGKVVGQLYNPATEEVVEEREIADGQQVAFTAVNAHEASEIQVGEVETVSEGNDSPSGE